jgi:hypothetical protein
MRVLVCGGRTYGIIPDGCPPDQSRYWRERSARERFFLRETLDVFHQGQPIDVLIHGGAKGADSIAGLWAAQRNIRVDVFKADWKALGKRAGPVRNARMLFEGKPDLVVAFPGGIGTLNMISQAKAAGVVVWEPGVCT